LISSIMQSDVTRKRPDVLFVITSLSVGGSERQLMLLASALAKEGMIIAVYGLNDGVIRADLERAGIEVIIAPSAGIMSVPLAALRLLGFMLTRRPCIVHFFLPAAYLIGAPVAALARIRVRIMSRRSLNNYQRNGFVRLLERLWHRTMDAVIGNSRRVVGQLSEEGVSRERLGLIYNGIGISSVQSDPAIRNRTRALLGLAPGALTMTIVANLIPYKGHRDLIDALALAAPRMPVGWRLLVVGRNDGIGARLRAQAAHLNLNANIIFLGSRDDVPAILAASDIGVLCSHEEGFSNAVLEAMAAGLPMAVTDVGGNAEAVVDGETGFVVPPRDSKALAEVITRLASDASLRERLGTAGRRRVAQRFGVAAFVVSHRSLYAALLAGRRPCDVPALAVQP
jgi:glycosyltransferase involved in cell wall biosynthesis